MADISQNISAQLFVKELPPSNRADYTGCKQDFKIDKFTTCVEDIPSDVAVENAFQKQLSLSEYYKSPYVFDTIKRDYMSKTMDGHFETQEVEKENKDVKVIKPVNDNFSKFTRSNFGNMNNNQTLLIVAAIAMILFFVCKSK